MGVKAKGKETRPGAHYLKLTKKTWTHISLPEKGEAWKGLGIISGRGSRGLSHTLGGESSTALDTKREQKNMQTRVVLLSSNEGKG